MLCSVTFLVLLSASAGAWFVAPDFVAVDNLLFGRCGAVATHELQSGEFLLFVPLELLGHVLDGGLRGALLPFGGGCVPVFFCSVSLLVLAVLVHREGRSEEHTSELQS